MGLSIHLTSPREGSVERILQYLNGEKTTGTLSVSFGRHLPDALVFLVTGSVGGAEFGQLIDLDVFDLILCQENAVKEIVFHPGREAARKGTLHSAYPHALFAAVKKPVKQCAARPFIYGQLEVRMPKSEDSPSLLRMIHSNDEYREILEKAEPTQLDRQAPLKECMLLRRAFDSNLIQYKNPLVLLKKCRPLLNLISPMEPKEAQNLRSYLEMLLPHSDATHMPLERFYAYASAIESIAYRRGVQVGDECRRIIYQIISENREGPGSAGVPAGRGPKKPSPLTTETEPKPLVEEPEILGEEDYNI